MTDRICCRSPSDKSEKVLVKRPLVTVSNLARMAVDLSSDLLNMSAVFVKYSKSSTDTVTGLK